MTHFNLSLRAVATLLPLVGLGLAGCGPASISECPPGAACTVPCERDSDCAAGQVCTPPGQPGAGSCALPALSCIELDEESCGATPGCVAIYSTPPCFAPGCGTVFDHCVTVASTSCEDLGKDRDCQARADCRWIAEAPRQDDCVCDCQPQAVCSCACPATTVPAGENGQCVTRNSDECRDTGNCLPTCPDGQVFAIGGCQPSCNATEQCGAGEVCSVELDGQCLNPCPDNPAGGACACLGVCQPESQPEPLPEPRPEPVPGTCQGLNEDQCNARSDCQATYCGACPPGKACFCEGYAGCTGPQPPG